MTENEAIERLECMRLFMQIEDEWSESKFLEDDYIANKMAIQALEEIQQYRTIGTVEELQAFRSDDFSQDLLNIGYTKGMKDGYNKAIDEFKRRLYGCEGNDVLRMMIPYENVCKVAGQMKVGDEE